jgi:hypothetical protein
MPTSERSHICALKICDLSEVDAVLLCFFSINIRPLRGLSSFYPKWLKSS